MTLMMYVVGIIVGVVVSTLLARMVSNWFTREDISVLKAFIAEVAFLLGSTVVLLLLVVVLNMMGMDVKEGLSLTLWMIAGGVAVLLVAVIGGFVYSLILPLNIAAGTAACFVSHTFIFVTAYVGILALTDFRIQLPVQKKAVYVTPEFSQGSLALMADESEIAKAEAPEPVKKTKMVRRKGYVDVAINKLEDYINRSIKYELPNGVTNKGVLLSVGKKAIEIEQSKGGGSIIYTVIKTEIRRIRAYDVWEVEVEVK